MAPASTMITSISLVSWLSTPATTRSRRPVLQLLQGGLSVKPSRHQAYPDRPPHGPLNGISDMLRAADAPLMAITSGGFIWSTERIVAINLYLNAPFPRERWA